ncbi:hypothetical protein D3C73_1530730 [compost metagenome]
MPDMRRFVGINGGVLNDGFTAWSGRQGEGRVSPFPPVDMHIDKARTHNLDALGQSAQKRVLLKLAGQ